jgi:phage-related protein (TIGR01555 family)
MDLAKLQRQASDVQTIVKRYDAWQNSLIGYGTSRDKVTAGGFAVLEPLSWVELQNLYYGDDIAARICDAKPEDMLRRGFKLEDYAGADELDDQLEQLGFEEKIGLAMTWANVYGGACLVIGADDGQEPMYPLDVERVRSVKFLNVVDRRFVYPISYYQDPQKAGFGEPEVYQVVSGLGGTIGFVHESRMIRFFGIKADPVTARSLGGWGYSVLQRVYEVMRQFATAFGSASQLTVDAGQAVFKIDGLLRMIASGEEQVMLGRMASVDMQRSSGRAVVLDSESEEFERQTVSLGGLSDILEMMMLRMSGAAKMPQTKLFGRSPSGMNATGESDMEQWYEECAAGQRKQLKPTFVKMLNVLTAGKWDGDVVFPPMQDPDEKKQADTDLVKAQTWKIYAVDIQAIQPEQVALAQFGDTPVEVDVVALKKIVELETKLALEEAKNPPPPPPMLPGAATPGPNGSSVPPNGAPPGAPPALPPAKG